MTDLDELGKTFLAIFDTILDDIWVVIWALRDLREREEE
jgi:hypothetical protein